MLLCSCEAWTTPRPARVCSWSEIGHIGDPPASIAPEPGLHSLTRPTAFAAVGFMKVWREGGRCSRPLEGGVQPSRSIPIVEDVSARVDRSLGADPYGESRIDPVLNEALTSLVLPGRGCPPTPAAENLIRLAPVARPLALLLLCLRRQVVQRTSASRRRCGVISLRHGQQASLLLQKPLTIAIGSAVAGLTRTREVADPTLYSFGSLSGRLLVFV